MPRKFQVYCDYCGVYFVGQAKKYCSRKCMGKSKRKSPFIDYQGEEFFYHDKGYYQNRSGVKFHRYIWSEKNGPIPDGHVIHHKDNNPHNNELENLELMSHGEHSSHHNKGRKHTLKARANMSKAHIGLKYRKTQRKEQSYG